VSARKGAATDKTDAAATHRPIGQGVLDPGTGHPVVDNAYALADKRFVVTASDDPARCARTGSLHVDDIWACVLCDRNAADGDAALRRRALRLPLKFQYTYRGSLASLCFCCSSAINSRRRLRWFRSAMVGREQSSISLDSLMSRKGISVKFNWLIHKRTSPPAAAVLFCAAS
jgi:hypothetical protein